MPNKPELGAMEAAWAGVTETVGAVSKSMQSFFFETGIGRGFYDIATQLIYGARNAFFSAFYGESNVARPQEFGLFRTLDPIQAAQMSSQQHGVHGMNDDKVVELKSVQEAATQQEKSMAEMQAQAAESAQSQQQNRQESEGKGMSM